MVPIYILGVLIRFGPQHGYQVKRTIAENVADFTSIKLPTIYYHLDKMEREGLLQAKRETEGSRPERTVYAVTDKGRQAFAQGLERQLALTYQPSFDADAIFYFAEHVDSQQVIRHLADHAARLERILAEIAGHQQAVANSIPKEQQRYVNIIFQHHLLHYRAEKTWAQNAVTLLRSGGTADDQTESH